MWRRGIAIAAVITGTGLLSGCATMSEDQCHAGAWGERGYADGLEGLSMSRLDGHAKACAKYGVPADAIAYSSARDDGLDRYCTIARGFQEGREGDVYNGVCTPAAEAAFLPAYQDGQTVHAAESELASAISSVDSLGARLEELDDKIEAKQSEARDDSLTQDQRDKARDRVGELRREREDRRHDRRRAQDAVDDAERRARDVRYRFQDIYGLW